MTSSLEQVNGVPHMKSAPGSLDNSGTIDRLTVAVECWEGVGESDSRAEYNGTSVLKCHNEG